MKKRILIVDDHLIVRQGFKQIISEEEDLSVAGEAGNGREALNLIHRQEFDAVVLDISMPGLGGLEVLSEIVAIRPELPILMLSTHPEEQFALRSLKSGAAGYLTKDVVPDELVKALRRILAGRRYITPSMSEVLAQHLTRSGDGPLHQELSDREFQVLRLLAKGLSIKEIGATLCLSPKTISTYRARLLEKMHMTNNAELTRYAVENCLLDSVAPTSSETKRPFTDDAS